MLASSHHLNGAGDYSEVLVFGLWMHPKLWVYCLSAAVCVINACHTRDIKNNPVANSISQNNCLHSALLGQLATKIILSTGGDGGSMYGWFFKPIFPRVRPIRYSLLSCGSSCHCSVYWNGISWVTLQFSLLSGGSCQLECSPIWPCCPTSRSRVLKNLGGGVALLWC